MHEHSLIADLIEKVEAIAREQKASGVKLVKVKLGALANISPSHFREHFTNETRDSLIEGALLEVEVSDDESDPYAQDIILESVDIEE